MIKELRLLIAEILMSWAYSLMPKSKNKTIYSQFIVEYFDKTGLLKNG